VERAEASVHHPQERHSPPFQGTFQVALTSRSHHRHRHDR
jgi:hypothetical protein